MTPIPWNRRRVLKAGSAFAAGLLAQPHAKAARPSRERESDLLEEARQLAAGSARSLRILAPEGCQANLRPIIDAFGRATGVDVTIEAVPVDEINAHLLVRSMAGDAQCDLALPATFGVPDLVEAGCLLELDALAAAFARYAPREPSLYRLGDRYKGRLYGLQTDGDTYLFFYNRRILEALADEGRFERELGRSPDLPRSWSELSELMRFAHDPAKGRFGGTLFRNPQYLVWEWWMRLHGKGLLPVDASMRPRFQEPEAREALAELVADSRLQHQSARSFGLFENWRLYAEGNALCNVGWGGTQKYLNGPESRVRDALVHDLPPGGQGGTQRFGFFNWGWNYVLTPSATNRELAFLFALFATSPVVSTQAVAQDGFFDPFRSEHYRSPEIVATYSKPFLDVHQSAMRQSIPDFYLAGQSEYFGVLRRFLTRADRGELGVDESLGLAAKAWESITDRMGRDNQIEQWGFIRSRYPSELLAQME